MEKHDTHFQFKQFKVEHAGATMKVGTDGVLLGAWCNLHNAKRLLDIGTGSGVIALMLAQRSLLESKIDAVDIEKQNVEQSIHNVSHCPWPAKVTIHHTPIQQFNTSIRYDLIITNPPFFNNSFEPPNQQRLLSRHTGSLPYAELLDAVIRLLHQSGRFNIILPHDEGLLFLRLASAKGLHCTRRWSFRTRVGKPIERWLFEFSFHPFATETGEILHYSSANNWSEQYKQLTSDFYLRG